MINIQQNLQKSLQLHQSGQTGEAIKLCQTILKTTPNEPNTLQLLGAFTKAQGDLAQAEKHLQASLKVNPNQPHVLNNLGNLYGDLENFEEAISCYQKATRQQPGYADAWFNWAVIERKQEKYEDSIARVKKAISLDPNQAKFFNLLGICLKRQEKYQNAIEALEQAVRLHPTYIQAIHNLGTVYREVERYGEAVQCFNYVLNNKPDQVETWEAIGSLYHSTEDFKRSIVAFNKLLELEPENFVIHRALNNMMWETGHHDGFLGSYVRAIEARPNSEKLIAAYAEELSLGYDFEKAINLINNAFDRMGKSPHLLHRLANIKIKTGDMADARHLLEETLKLDQTNEEYYTDYAQILLETGDYEEALIQADHALKINPDYQKTWAIKGDCWRLLGNEKYHWLYDFDNLIKPIEINVPAGFSSLDSFNESLEEELTKLHITNVNPRDQTLIGGTQTVGELYQNRNPVIQKLRDSILKAAIRYIKGLPDDEKHPHLRRKTQNIKFSGAWSVRLISEGFHVDHYHPKGWMSGPYYVKLPKIIRDSTEEGDKPGWVKFGASRYGPEDYRIPHRIIKPQTGVQVFFPSYTWHGTNPFQSDEIRMTAPCDIVPL